MSAPEGTPRGAGYRPKGNCPAILVTVSPLLAGPFPASAQTSKATVYRPGDGGVSAPVAVGQLPPSYTAEATALGIEGSVGLECVVETDGSVGDVRVVRSLEPSLDQAAVVALKTWRFKPGMKGGEAVRVLTEVERAFTLDQGPRLDSADVFKPGENVTVPMVLKEVKPQFPLRARSAPIRGTVTLDCVVLPDGRVGHTRVTHPLDPDLDREAIRALKQWRFAPGRRQGKPVAVQVSVEMTFVLK